jgi:protein TonB
MRRRDIIIGCVVALAILVAAARYGSGPHVIPLPAPKPTIIEVPPLPPIEPDTTPLPADAAAKEKPKATQVSPPDIPDVPQPPQPDRALQPLEPPLPPGPKDLVAIPAGPIGPPGPAIIEISALSEKPIAKYQAKPVYPNEAKKAGLEGEVDVGFIVDPDGNVRNATALRSTSREFEDSAVQAVGRWTFKPGKKDGKAVFTRMQVPVVFSLKGGD